jgi:hypothetical protein
MTEAEWLACGNSAGMLGFLGDRPSARRLRLFACACCRRHWSGLSDVRSQSAVIVAERFADGLATKADLSTAFADAGAAVLALPPHTLAFALAQSASHACHPDWRPVVVAVQAAWASSWVPNTAPRGKAGRAGRHQRQSVGTALAALLRDLIGNPFRPLPALSPTWLAWGGELVFRLAETIYGEQAFDRLPVLADALEDAGCANAELLGHLRGPGPHVRGCWALDLLLGKE